MRLGRLTYLLAGAVLLCSTPLLAQDAQSQLWDAAMLGDTTSVLQALANGAKIDSLDTRRSRNGRRALNWAAIHNRVAMVKLLLAKGATLDAQNLTGFTPLHHAAEAGSLEAARVLLEAGADPTLPNTAGRTPAETARSNQFPELASLLETAARNDKPRQQ